MGAQKNITGMYSLNIALPIANILAFNGVSFVHFAFHTIKNAFFKIFGEIILNRKLIRDFANIAMTTLCGLQRK